MDLPYSTRFGIHDLGNSGPGAIDGKAMFIGGNAHNSEHAAGQGCGHQVGGRKRFPFSFVVGRSIGDDGIAGQGVGAFGAQVAGVLNC